MPGLDGRLSLIDDLTYWGRRGAAHPGGEVGMSMLNEMCNPGTVNIPWQVAMSSNHPKFGFLIVRVNGGKIEQINDWSYCKHAFTSTNFSGACGTCQNPGTGQLMGVHCSDTYGAGNNGDRYWLGPARGDQRLARHVGGDRQLLRPRRSDRRRPRPRWTACAA